MTQRLEPLTPEFEFDDNATVLYRFYDREGNLLYVGITNDLAKRMRAHRGHSRWWPQATRRAMTWYGTRGAAECAEGLAILSEKPRHNVMKRPARDLAGGAKQQYVRRAHRLMSAPLPGLLGRSPYELRLRRLDLGLTQVEAAKLLGVGIGTFQAWEAGRRPPSPEQLRAYFKMLGLPAEDAAPVPR